MVRSLIPLRYSVPRSLSDLHNDVEHLFDYAFRKSDDTAKSFVPRINIAETAAEFEISVELPGLKPNDVKVELNDGQLTISGEVKTEIDQEDKTFHRIERNFGEFQRAINVPETVDEEHIDANFSNGVLVVKLPKAEKPKPKTISVKSVG